jgi:ABC-type transporter Mla maintaining outer membrane lipid asymmetry permease subunit MlaE
MGLVLTIQLRPTLVEFGAEAMLPSMVALSLVREISPVITALICAGKVGSGMGAELGFMLIHGKCYADDTLERLEKTEDKEIKEFFCL